MLRHYVSPQMDDWDKHLGMIHFAINNAWQESVQETPFLLKHGRHPKTVLNLALPYKGNSQGQPTRNPAACEFLRKMQDITA